ncbi:UBX domain-containing protein 8 [Denticeps clupeoides]|uniref:UBX domain-containing protein 8 n=1 Tax=Denticeps clupeoides TaxID=299321 RepID=UPI0010A30D43|nr:UBX domain-containing protein 8 [Denticeps clupeoides]
MWEGQHGRGMKMPLSRSSVTLCILSLSFLCFVSWKHSVLGVRDAIVLAGRAFLLLAACSWTGSCLIPWLKTLLFTDRAAESAQAPAEDDEARVKQRTSRRAQQEQLAEKVRFHEESVVKPRKESLQRRKEKRFYRMTGEVWKLTQGQKLGEGEPREQDLCADEEQSASQRAARRRKLPETVSPMPVKRDPPQSKRVIILPEEPQANTEGVVKVALRCPSGRTVYRRFLKCHTSTVLLDWMLKTGYHPMIYTVCMSYPRKPLETGPLMTLEDVGIVRDTVLNVEEKDQSTT